MSRTIRTIRTAPERRQRRLEAAAAMQRQQNRDAYRASRREAAPERLWVLSGDWGDGFTIRPLRAGGPGPGESLISDPGDVAHLWADVTHWEV